MKKRHHKANQSSRGFSFVELIIVIVIILILTAAAIPFIKSTMKEARVRSAYEDVLSTMRRAHEVAADRRRVVVLTFNPAAGGKSANIQFLQETFTPGVGGNPGTYSPSPAVNTANPETINLPTDMDFMLPTASSWIMPEAFSSTAPISATDYGYSPNATGAGLKVIYFQSDGTALRDSEQGAIASGVIYVGRTGDTLSNRAVSILGQTGRIKGWRFFNGAWQEYK